MLSLRPGLAEATEREHGQTPSSLLAMRMAKDQSAASVAVLPALGDSASTSVLRGWVVQSLLLDAIAHDMCGDAAGTEQALERALDMAVNDRVLLPFLVHPVPTLLERHAHVARLIRT